MYVTQSIMSDQESLLKWYGDLIDRGFEGLVIKYPNDKYQLS